MRCFSETSCGLLRNVNAFSYKIILGSNILDQQLVDCVATMYLPICIILLLTTRIKAEVNSEEWVLAMEQRIAEISIYGGSGQNCEKKFRTVQFDLLFWTQC